MEGDNWQQENNGLIIPPRHERNWRDVYPAKLLEEMREEIRNTFDGAVSEFREAAFDGGGLGLTSYYQDKNLGEAGFAPGAINEALRLLANHLTALTNGLYGGQFGYGYATNSQEVGDVVRQLSMFMHAFAEYNPLIKNMVRIRATYVFGEGVEVLAESEKRIRKYIKKLNEEREMEKQLRMQQLAQAQSMGADQQGGGQQQGGGGQKGGQQGGGGQARNALYQRYGGTGRAPSIPGGRRESFAEAKSGAGGGTIGYRFPVGGVYGMLGGEEEPSDISVVVRKFFEDPCNRMMFCSVDTLQKMDMQLMIEGNAFVCMRNRGKGKTPAVNILPTTAIQSVIVDDLPDGMGTPLGYVVAPISTYGVTGQQQQKLVFPSMVSNDVPRLRKVMETRRMTAYKIDTDARIYHLKEWGPAYRTYGVPGILASLVMATNYMSYIGEWVDIQRVLKTYILMVSGNGNTKGLNQIQTNYIARVANIFGGNEGPGGLLNSSGQSRLPPYGMAALSGQNAAGMPGTKIEPMHTAGATDPPNQAREIKMMALMGAGYPDNMYADTSAGTMSRQDVLERQTHLIFRSGQEKYADMFKAISLCVVEMQLGPEQLDDVQVQINWPAIVKPSTLEQASALIQMYGNDGIMRKVFVEECYKLLNRSDRHEMMQIAFMNDEDGFEFKSDNDMDTLANARMGAPGMPGESTDINDPLAAMEDDGLWPSLNPLYG